MKQKLTIKPRFYKSVFSFLGGQFQLADGGQFHWLKGIILVWREGVILVRIFQQALDLGANDYLTKPFRTGELLARVRAAIRQDRIKEDNPVIEIGNLSIDIVNHIAKKDSETLKLTTTEFSMLFLFARNQGCVLTHQFILKEIWGKQHYSQQSQNLRVFVAQLRKKIEDNPSNRHYS